MMEMAVKQQIPQLNEGIVQPGRGHDTRDHSLAGKKSIALHDRFKMPESRQNRSVCIFSAILAAAMAGRIDGIMRIVSLVVEQL